MSGTWKIIVALRSDAPDFAQSPSTSALLRALSDLHLLSPSLSLSGLYTCITFHEYISRECAYQYTRAAATASQEAAEVVGGGPPFVCRPDESV